MHKVKIEDSWKALLSSEFKKPYFTTLVNQLRADKLAGKTVYPPGNLIFKAFELTPVDNLKVVIIGQDPYHKPGQAMGLCFSVPQGTKVPPSLKNIYKEMHSDLEIPIRDHGDLTIWAEQGVLLLNAILTVEDDKPASHRKYGWQSFTDSVIKTISDDLSDIVFILWGNYAKSKMTLIDDTKHLILQAAHPSPLARFGFKGCKHFSKCNDYLIKLNKEPIQW
jgi:uracil-DNA glycosylase